ncbi:SusC/RagA family TonB-linked outer membrane protein [Sphingobacterium humi]|uniref:SusC/RagA family TonB-linked outer membrane protein n=1 Tax=Sphingobacterium humi TaxID=1796905 RepID=A0A6N8L402_9SPHI|nr:SusC/RagA family TonB-linked outer membrane protein [Sphingobacterium humi]MVZ62502.1 SusC/RagA family TonB-linked outer membrane protein [Sphingobacterium humi]
MMNLLYKQITSLLFLLLLCGISTVYAQKSISGTVRSEQGPLTGVTVQLIGSIKKTQTNATGQFSIEAKIGDKLRFSIIGYTSLVLSVDKETMQVNLQTESASIDEVVITGLGESRERRQLGYSMTQISSEDIRKTNAINPIAALQGLVPGLQVNVGTGGPQSTSRFQIRGASSLNQYGNTPLVVIDGIIMDEEVVLPNRGGDQDFGNILKNINIDDIESISVINGGSVTALYGSRASNGVILISTKKGYSQKGLGINFTHSQGFDKPYSSTEMQNKYGPGSNPTLIFQKDNDGNELMPAQNYAYSFGPAFDGRTLKDIDGRMIKYQANNNALSIFQTGRYMNSNLGIQGGNEQTTFRFSYSNMYSHGVAPNNKLTRNNFNFRATHRIGEILLLDANATYVNGQSFNPQYGGERWNMGNNLFYSLSYGMPRTYDLAHWRHNYLDPIQGGVNTTDPTGKAAILFLLYENKQQQSEDNFRGSFNAKINFNRYFQLENNFSANLFNTHLEVKNRGYQKAFHGGYYATYTSRVLQTRYRSNLNYNQSFEDFEVFTQAGMELNHSLRNGLRARAPKLNIPDVFRLSNASEKFMDEDKPNQFRSISAFFQASLTYKQNLNLNLYGRNDWDSSLVYPDGRGNFSYFYPGMDIAWTFSDMLKLPQHIINYGKLRFSYNQVGKGTSVYNAMTGYYLPRDIYDKIPNYGFDSKKLGNADLKPERSDTWEAGTEIKMLQNRFGFDFTFYRKNTKNQIINLPISRESGVTSKLINSGLIRNQGIELKVFGTPIKTQNFSWDMYFNYTRNWNKIIDLAPGVTTHELDGDDGIRAIAVVGGEYGTLIARYGHARYQAKDEQGNAVAHKYNGQPVMNASGTLAYYVRSQDYAHGTEREVTLGSTLPKFLGSIINKFNYKSFSLSFMLDAKFGGLVYSPTYNYGMQTGQIANSLYGRMGEAGSVSYSDSKGNEAWGMIPEGVFGQGVKINGTNVEGMSYQDAMDAGLLKPINAVNYYNITYGWGNGIREKSVFKSSWVMLRDISASYDLPKNLTSKMKLNNLRMTISARNIGYLYNSLPVNLNPEDYRSNGSVSAFLGGGSPLIRNFSFTINTNF